MGFTANSQRKPHNGDQKVLPITGYLKVNPLTAYNLLVFMEPKGARSATPCLYRKFLIPIKNAPVQKVEFTAINKITIKVVSISHQTVNMTLTE